MLRFAVIYASDLLPKSIQEHLNVGSTAIEPREGDVNALRCCLALAQKIRGIMAAFPKDVPVISSHPIAP